jgi:hypothetical protein
MLFHAMMEFCLDLLRLKCWLIGEWSIGTPRPHTLFGAGYAPVSNHGIKNISDEKL